MPREGLPGLDEIPGQWVRMPSKAWVVGRLRWVAHLRRALEPSSAQYRDLGAGGYTTQWASLGGVRHTAGVKSWRGQQKGRCFEQREGSSGVALEGE